jgi:hypothetical protein
MQHYLDRPESLPSHGAAARTIAERDLSWDKNAAGLAGWIARQERLAGGLPGAWSAMAGRAAEYDRHNSPTPLERILVGGKAMLRHWISTCKAS